MTSLYNGNLITMDTAVEILLQKDANSVQEVERINNMIRKAQAIHWNSAVKEFSETNDTISNKKGD